MSVDATGSAERPFLVEVIGNPRSGSRTRQLADAVGRAVVDRFTADETAACPVRVLELGEIVGITFGPEPARGSGAVADPFATARAARVLVVATPTYKATYTGLLKVFLDRFGHGDLAGVVGVPVALAASEEHRHSVQTALRDLLVELGVSVPAPAVATLETELQERSADVVARAWADRYGSVLVDAVGRRDESAHTRAGAGS